MVGTCAWYGREVDPKMAATLSSIASRQPTSTENMEREVKHFWNYCTTHPDAGVRFHASDMILLMHSDVSYLSEPESKSRAAGHLYLSKRNNEKFNNGAVVTLSKIIKHVMTSASEVETAALFYNCKAAIPIQISLKEMGHTQPKTPVITDSTSAQGLISKTITPERAKSYDVRFNWLKYREAQNQFDIVCRKGTLNRADYHSKHHPVRRYMEKQGQYVIYMPLSRQ